VSLRYFIVVKFSISPFFKVEIQSGFFVSPFLKGEIQRGSGCPVIMPQPVDAPAFAVKFAVQAAALSKSHPAIGFSKRLMESDPSFSAAQYPRFVPGQIAFSDALAVTQIL
jgi:hypothetical protein